MFYEIKSAYKVNGIIGQWEWLIADNAREHASLRAGQIETDQFFCIKRVPRVPPTANIQ